MTSASELFYNRRSRFGRNSLDLGLDSSPDRSFHHHSHSNRRHQHHNTRRDRHDLDACDPPRRTPMTRHQSHRPSNLDRDTPRLDGGSSHPSSGNTINVDNLGGIHSSPRFSENNRLPGAVLLARERLVQRLRGVSFSGSRQRNRPSSRVNRNDLTFQVDFRLFDAGDWETETSREWLAEGAPFTDSLFQTDQSLLARETSKRPPGLSQQALECLQVEVFSETRSIEDREKLRASQECAICLESFLEGDELLSLPCAHKFHLSCLDPWVRTCGDCPYCRREIVLSSCLEE